jgi:hypothetical protein
MRRIKDINIPITYLQECFEPNTTLDRVRWKIRPIHHFPNKQTWRAWNVTYSGNLAGSINSQRYRIIKIAINGGIHTINEHRVLWALTHGKWPIDQLDHKNRARGDNLLSNLRESTQLQNSQNTGLRRNNRSGITGVSYEKYSSKWVVQLRLNGHLVYKCRFDNFADAVAARKTVERRWHPFAPP